MLFSNLGRDSCRDFSSCASSDGNAAGAPSHERVGAVRASQMWSSVLGRVWHYLTCDLNISTQSKMMHYLSVTMSNLLQRYLAAFLWKHSSRGSARRSCAALAANITHTPAPGTNPKKGQTDAHCSSYLMLIFLCKLLTSRCCVNNDASFCLCIAPFRKRAETGGTDESLIFNARLRIPLRCPFGKRDAEYLPFIYAARGWIAEFHLADPCHQRLLECRRNCDQLQNYSKTRDKKKIDVW